MKNKRYNLLQSFSFAIEGICQAFKKERNLKIELGFALGIILVGFILGFEVFEWFIVFVLIALVLSAEILNSAIEAICNLLNEKLKLEYKETRQIRNMAAGAVFLLACFAALVGVLIVIPHLVDNL